jgi:hypothetical protein
MPKSNDAEPTIRCDGREEGSLAEAKRLVLLLGENRFGPPDSMTKTAVESIHDVKRLEEMGVHVLDVASWTDLLNPTKARRRNGRPRSKEGPSR